MRLELNKRLLERWEYATIRTVVLYVCISFGYGVPRSHLKCFVLNTLCYETKHLRHLIRDLVWGFEWLEILGLISYTQYWYSTSEVMLVCMSAFRSKLVQMKLIIIFLLQHKCFNSKLWYTLCIFLVCKLMLF